MQIVREILIGVPAKKAFGLCGWSNPHHMAETGKDGLAYWHDGMAHLVPWPRVEARARLYAPGVLSQPELF